MRCMVLGVLLTGCSPDIGCADADEDDYHVGYCGSTVKLEPADADDDASVYPGAPELCDGLDNDLDGVIDEGLPDGDGDGDPDCRDCAPDDPAMGGYAVELGNGLDDDCDGEVDEGYPASISVGTLQDLVREREAQIVEVSCVLCGDSPSFTVAQADPGASIPVVDISVAGELALLTVEVPDDAALGYYDLTWSVRGETGVAHDAVRLSRGQVRIDDVSPDIILLNHPDRVEVVLDGGNYSWDAVVELWDDQGNMVICEIDEVAPDRIDCHFDDTYWSLEEGDALLSVRDETDTLDCAGGYSQACYDRVVLKR